MNNKNVINYFLVASFLIGMISIIPNVAASQFPGYLEQFSNGDPPTKSWHGYTCTATVPCGLSAEPDGINAYVVQGTATGVSFAEFTLIGISTTGDWSVDVDYKAQRPGTLTTPGGLSFAIITASSSRNVNLQWVGGGACTSGGQSICFKSLDSSCGPSFAFITGAVRYGHVTFNFVRSTDTFTINDGINPTCTVATGVPGQVYRSLTKFQIAASSGSDGVGSYATNVVINANDGAMYTFRDGQATPATGSKPFSTVRTDYNSPSTVFAIEFGQIGSGSGDAGCPLTEANYPCGTTVRYGPTLSELAKGHSCNPQSNPALYVDLVAPIGYQEFVTTTDKFEISCAFANTNPSDSGWGLLQLNYGSPMSAIDSWNSGDNVVRDNIRVEGLNLNKVYVLLDNGVLNQIDSFSAGLTNAQRLTHSVNLFPANDFSQSKNGNGKLAVVTGSDNRIYILDSNLNVLSTTTTTDNPKGVEIYGNNLYTCGTTQIKKYTINNDNSLTQLSTVGSGCTDTGQHNGRVLRLTKDGQYLTYINHTASIHDVEIFNTTGLVKLFTSNAYTNVYSDDVDVLNTRLYVSVPSNTVTPQIDYYDISSFTTAFGNVSNQFPDGMNPYDNITLYPNESQGGVNNTVNVDGGTLGEYNCGEDSNSFFSTIVCNLAPILPTGIEGAKWFFGIVIVVIVIIWVYRATESAISIPIGAFLGVGLAIGIGFIPIWFMMAIVFLLIIIVANMFFGGNDDG